MAPRPLSPAESTAAAREAGRVAAWGLVIFAGTRLAAAVLDSMSMASIVAQTIIAELGVGRLGVAWSDPTAPMPDTATIARRALLGAAVGGVIACAVTSLLVATGAVVLTRSVTSLSPLAVALVTAGLLSMRDELLLHGLVMRAMVSIAPQTPRVIACGLTSAASAIGEGAPARAVLAHGLLGLVFGVLWARDRGAWQAFGAHTAWLFASAALLEGGFFDAAAAANTWGGGDAGVFAGSAFVVALLPFGAGAILTAARADRQDSPPGGAVG